MNTLYMLVGLPGAGKTSAAKRIRAERIADYQQKKIKRDVIWISSDAIREELYGSEDVQGDSNHVFELMRKRTEIALKNGDDVIYDACNINSKRRRAFLNALHFFGGKKVCVICATPYEECLTRNEKRERVVPKVAIRKMYMNWSTPYYFEGWDKIDILYSADGENSGLTPEDYPNHYMNYEQDNPYHKETLGEHLLFARNHLTDEGVCDVNDNLAVATLIHDCGKPYTKTFENSKGETTEVAHYYQHANVGAYDALFFKYENKTVDDILKISILINLHMDPHYWTDSNVAQKKEKLWGKDLLHEVLLLHEADLVASKD